MGKSISQLQLNRTLLSRQMLLGPVEPGANKAVERLVALQAQVASPPYFGLWSRVPGFEPSQLMALRDSEYGVRTHLPLVQVSPAGSWKGGSSSVG